MLKLIVFDWDDVFSLGSTEGYMACYQAAINDVGIYLDPDEERKRIKSKWGSPHREEIAELLREHPHLIDKASERYESHLFDGTFVGNISLVDGSINVLEKLSSKFSLAIASGVHPKLLREEIFPKFGVSPKLFTQILTTYDLEDPSQAKPSPYMLNEIMRIAGVSPDETIMVGDAKGDIEMSKSAGIEPVAVLTGHLSRSEAVELDVNFILSDVAELPNLLESKF